MLHCRTTLVVALALSLAGSGFAQAPPTNPTIDETYLKNLGIGTDAKSLIGLLRDQADNSPPPRDLDELVSHLGDPSFAKREYATHRIIDGGPAALKPLREIHRDDPEVQRRVERCIGVLASRLDKTVGYFAVRHLLRTGPPGAAAAVLAYLPFADDETVIEIWYGLEALTARKGKVDASVVAALSDAEPRRRELAAFLVARHGGDVDRRPLPDCLADERSEVRLRAAQGLLSVCDRGGIPVLIDLLRAAPLDTAWQAEELLHWLAGDDSPKAILGAATPATRKRCNTAWKQWWRVAAARFDWERVERSPRRPGLCVVGEDRCVTLRGCDGTVRWELDGVYHAGDAQMLPGPRLLMLDCGNLIAAELYVGGRITWSSADFPRPPARRCQRLANGATLVCTTTTAIELGQQGEVLSYHPLVENAMNSIRLRDGRFLARTADGLLECPSGLCRLSMAGPGSDLCDNPLTAGADGACFLYDSNARSIVRIESLGGSIWKRHLPRIGALVALRNGNVLAVLQDRRLVEINSAEQIVSEIFLPGDFDKGQRGGWIPSALRDAYALIRLGFDRPVLAERDLDAVDKRILDLKDKNPRVRCAAVSSLGLRGSEVERAVPALVAALEDKDPSVAAAVTIALGNIGPTALPELLKATLHPSEMVRDRVWEFLYNFGPRASPAVPALLALLSDPKVDEWTRMRAALTLGRIGPDAEAAIPALLHVLRTRSESDQLRQRSVHALGRIGIAKPEIIAALVDAMKDAQNPWMQTVAVSALHWFGQAAKDAVPQLTQVFADASASTELRIAAIAVVADLESAARPAINPLCGVLCDRTQPEGVRRQVVACLSKLRQYAEPVVPVLAEVLTDAAGSDDLKIESQRLLEQLGTDSLLVLTKLAGRGYSPARYYALDKLRRLGPDAQAALPVLQQLATDDPDAEIRRRAGAAIDDIAQPRPAAHN